MSRKILGLLVVLFFVLTLLSCKINNDEPAEAVFNVDEPAASQTSPPSAIPSPTETPVQETPPESTDTDGTGKPETAESEEKVEIDPKDYTGIWHQSEGVPAGYAERYRFNADGTFVYVNSDMDGASREVALAGSWEVDGGNLILIVKYRDVIYSGNPIPAWGSYGSDWVIEGGIYLEVILDEGDYETRVYEISDVTVYEPEDYYDGRRTVFIDGWQYWDFSSYEDMLPNYDAFENEYTDTFDYGVYTGGGTVYANDGGERANITDLPFITIDDVKYYVQEAEADLNGDGIPEKIKIFYETEYDDFNKKEWVQYVKVQINDGTNRDTLEFYAGNCEKGVYFADFNSTGKTLYFCLTKQSGFLTYILTFTNGGKIKYASILGNIESYDGEGKIYTEYNRIFDDGKTLLSYFDVDKGLIPFEKKGLIGKEITFSCGVLLLKEPRNYVGFRYGDLEQDYSREYRLRDNGDNVLAEVPPGEKLVLLDFYYELRDDRYEIYPWLKVETADGTQGWFRIQE